MLSWKVVTKFSSFTQVLGVDSRSGLSNQKGFNTPLKTYVKRMSNELVILASHLRRFNISILHDDERILTTFGITSN